MTQSTPSNQSSADMKVDLAALKNFESAILKVLDDLTADDADMFDPYAAPLFGNVNELGEISGDFAEATGLMFISGYAVSNIRQLAKMVRQQIEAMALTIKMAGDSSAMADQKNQAKLSTMLYGEQGKPGDLPFNAERPVPANPAAGAPPAGPPQTGTPPAGPPAAPTAGAATTSG